MSEASYSEELIDFAVGQDRCEATLAYPDAGRPHAALLVLAPHPHFGGNMLNNVVRAFAQHAAADGLVTLRFNYRGVGKSSLTLPPGQTSYAFFQDIEARQDYQHFLPDCAAAWQALTHAAPGLPGILVGYSLGSVLAGLLASTVQPSRIVGIAPPTARVSFDVYRDCQLPKCFLAGDTDFAFDEAKFIHAFDAMPQPRTYIPMPGSDHFFRLEELRLYESCRNFILGTA